MSVVQNPIVGRSSGKFSNAIFSKWKSKNTLRSKPLVVNQPNTDAQLEQRNAFKAAVAYARSILFFLRFSLKSISIDMSEFNTFIRKNVGNIASPSFKFNPAAVADLVFSAGTLPPLTVVDIPSVAGLDLTFEWDNTYLTELRNVNDEVSIIIYNITTDTIVIHEGVALFTAGTVTFQANASAGDSVACYICTHSALRTDYSNSQYVDTVVL